MCMICDAMGEPVGVPIAEDTAERVMAQLQAVAEAGLVEMARGGGDKAARAMANVLRATNTATEMWRERDRTLQAGLADAQVTIRAMVGQPMPDDRREVMDPPEHHTWTTATGAQGRFTDAHMGRLYCVTCTVASRGNTVLAGKCLGVRR